MLKKDGKFVLGEGREELLEWIDKKGTISEAAEEMNMSYRHAWGKVKKIEEVVGKEVVKSQRGGDKNRGSTLTPTGKKLLSDYQELKKEHKGDVYRNPSPTVDGIVKQNDKLLLIKRKNSPFKGDYALPGGFVEYNEPVEKAVIREVEEETGLKTKIKRLIGVYSAPDRDPRGHMISTVFSLDITGGSPEGGSDAEKARYFDIEHLPELAFDHEDIIDDFLELLDEDWR
ncbi:MAG: NUDIX domain-containing protein [Candidatus Thermoplasmatota archaeon]|nr:NUDIX domain-containing protein [Candidatus Thermoplasmatota archaeon]MBS3790362.1 NUDIX domain-containing protein [Candidatus Thermoplasmatota archaeon]